ncbi:M20/M25/M40 family metallo-hydrolase [Carboxylicivirga sp. A043]|uniref:M28 family metallopeptidase n=1 Tax=Carboxylicivirga litoralis TaxID=2816963 RepID=UPI0021CB1A20|nr:M20/M25/M40 family metallo-hydrolase [Carboxylicivirga sp. A043]MCU4154948.1 M20/M25/M40 family metallo-hydrolase [Carboxylicivirga sp. A043]
MYKQLIILPILFITTVQAIFAQENIRTALATINRNSLEAELSFLSSDWFEGREATTKGAYMAADYLASLYKTAGLTTIDNTTYFQNVPLLIAATPAQASIVLSNKVTSKTYSFPTHLRAERVTESYNISSEFIWGGYGINNEQLNEINLKKCQGKVLIRISGLPKAKADSPLKHMLEAQPEREWNQIKNNALQKSGAVAVLEYDLNDPYLTQSIEESPAPIAQSEKELSKRSSGIYKKSLFLPDEKKQGPYFYKVSKAIMTDLIPDFDQFIEQYLNNLEQLKTTAPKLNYTSAQLITKASVESKKCQNVIAVIEGSEKPDEIIVVGAHYDHLGMYEGYIWNGADDNGSGAIGTVAIARAFMATGIQPKRTVIFANWTAEERGLLGSRYFVNTYKDIDKVKYYHNYDMIGRSYNYEQPDSAVTLLYTKSWQQAEKLCSSFNKDYQFGLKINYSAWDDPTSGSDNAPFAKKGIPIMWFHTGGHESYHMPSDHAERIDWQKFEAIVKTSFLTLWSLANE